MKSFGKPWRSGGGGSEAALLYISGGVRSCFCIASLAIHPLYSNVRCTNNRYFYSESSKNA